MSAMVAVALLALLGAAAVMASCRGSHRTSRPSRRACLRFGATGLPLVAGLVLAAPQTAFPDTTAGANPVLTTSAPVLTVPTSIAKDCSKDVTADIQRWIDGVPNGATLQFSPGACYQVEGSLLVVGRSGLIFDGRGAIFRAKTNGVGTSAPPKVPGNYNPFTFLWPRSRSQWIGFASENLTWRNMTIQAPNSSCTYYGQPYEEQAAIHIDGVNGAVVENITASGTYGDFVTISGSNLNGVARPSSKVRVTGNTFTCAGRQGIAVTDATDVSVTSNTLKTIARSAFDIEPPTVGRQARRVTFDSNTVSGFRGVFLANLGTGIISDITVSNNRLPLDKITVTAKAPAELRRSNYRIVGNVTDVKSDSSMSFAHIDGLLVSGNRMTVNGVLVSKGKTVYSGIAVKIHGVTRAEVRDNVFAKTPTQAVTGDVTPLSADPTSSAYSHCNNITNPNGAPPPADGPCKS